MALFGSTPRVTPAISNAPLGMPPFPSATKAPTMVWNSPLEESDPVVENTYVPFKSPLTKPPLGGGTALGELLPQPTRNASKEMARNEVITWRTDITASLGANQFWSESPFMRD